MINALKEQLFEIARADSNIVLISVDDSELYEFFTPLGERYICGGISECNMVGVAAGMASCGYVPFVIAGGTFLSFRAVEFIRNEVCLQKLKVNFVGIGAGMAISYLGSTHHCTEDIGVLRSIPSLTTITPATPCEVKSSIKYAVSSHEPVYLRIGRTVNNIENFANDMDLQIGKIQIIKYGKDILLLSTGSILYNVLQVADYLAQEGMDVGIANIRTNVPADIETLEELAGWTKKWVCVEEHNTNCGIGSIIADVIVERKLKVGLLKVGLNSWFSFGHGSYEEIKRLNGLDSDSIYKKCLWALDNL